MAGTAVFGAPDPAAAVRQLKAACATGSSVTDSEGDRGDQTKRCWVCRSKHGQWASSSRSSAGSSSAPSRWSSSAPVPEGVEVGPARAGLPRPLDLATGDTVSFRENVQRPGHPGEHLGHLVRALPRRDAGDGAALQGLGPKGFRIAAVSIDEGSLKDVTAFATELGLTFDILQDKSGKIQTAYQTTGVSRELPARPERGHRQAASSASTPGARRSTSASWPSCSASSCPRRRPPPRPIPPPARMAELVLGIETPATRPPRPSCAIEDGRAVAREPGDPLAGHPPGLRRRGARAGQPGAPPPIGPVVDRALRRGGRVARASSTRSR